MDCSVLGDDWACAILGNGDIPEPRVVVWTVSPRDLLQPRLPSAPTIARLYVQARFYALNRYVLGIRRDLDNSVGFNACA